jgi:hypothetical protein
MFKVSMKSVLIVIFNLFSIVFLYSQDSCKSFQLPEVNIRRLEDFSSLHTEYRYGFPAGTKYILTNDTALNKVKLLKDDAEYNKRYQFWYPLTLTTGTNVLTWGYDRYILNASFSRVGFKTWKYNLTHGWVWDTDRFGVDFLGHPISGAMFFNTARSSGYSFVQSFPYAVFGSVQWKYFGENDSPTINDLITTSVAGSLAGEILYRLSSNILDDTKRGSERVFREIFAGLVDPVRGVNRLLKGTAFRVTSKEIYQKEPVKISLGAGVQKISEGIGFGAKKTSELLNLSIVYGDPFENRIRKPFDFFESNIILDNGDRAGKSIVDNLSAFGLLYGKNAQAGNTRLMTGIFQHYDYFNNSIFELGNLTFSGGILSKMAVGQKSFLYSNLHLGIVPFGGYSVKLGPDTALFRDFNYGGGAGVKLESTFGFRNIANLNISALYYWMFRYTGTKENNLIGIIRPTLLIRVAKNVQLGFQYFLYTNDKYFQQIHTSNLKSSEQKFMLLFDFGTNKSAQNI